MYIFSIKVRFNIVTFGLPYWHTDAYIHDMYINMHATMLPMIFTNPVAPEYFVLYKHTCTHAHTHTHIHPQRTHTHARTHTHIHTHAHTYGTRFEKSLRMGSARDTCLVVQVKKLSKYRFLSYPCQTTLLLTVPIVYRGWRLAVSYEGEISLPFNPLRLYSCCVWCLLLREIIRIYAHGLSGYR